MASLSSQNREPRNTPTTGPTRDRIPTTTGLGVSPFKTRSVSHVTDAKVSVAAVAMRKINVGFFKGSFFLLLRLVIT